jgi:(p)ppGpp synthase/HD superfamily hydrolase
MFSDKVERALRAALEAHRDQFRKGTQGVPYVTHPLHVALILARRGMDEDLIVAGLLHDVVEDNRQWSLARVAAEFGVHVKGIVEQLTEDKSRTWEERKRAAIEKIPHMSPEAATVKAVDKLHNLQTLLADLGAAEDQEEVWKRFNGGRQRTLEQDERLVEALCTRIEPNLGRSLRAAQAAVADCAARAPRPERV